MLVFSAHGYYYTVEDPTDEKSVVVYAHKESDLMHLVNHHCMIAGAPTRTAFGTQFAKTMANPARSYFGWQVRMSKDEWATGVARIALELDYSDLEDVLDPDDQYLNALDEATYGAYAALTDAR